MNKLTIPTHTEFVLWLYKKRFQSLGKPQSINGCPLSTMIGELHRGLVVSVAKHFIQIGNRYMLTPPWMRHVITLMDENFFIGETIKTEDLIALLNYESVMLQIDHYLTTSRPLIFP